MFYDDVFLRYSFLQLGIMGNPRQRIERRTFTCVGYFVVFPSPALAATKITRVVQ